MVDRRSEEGFKNSNPYKKNIEIYKYLGVFNMDTVIGNEQNSLKFLYPKYLPSMLMDFYVKFNNIFQIN